VAPLFKKLMMALKGRRDIISPLFKLNCRTQVTVYIPTTAQ
jgi:hypothetical protein